MNLYFRGPSGLITEVNQELTSANPIEHILAHWEMLKFAFAIKNTKEIIVQIPRLIVGGIKSFVGEIRISNTGRANVPPLFSMEIPADLQAILNRYKA